MPGLLGFARSLVDPRVYIGLLRLVHFYNYDHVTPRRQATLGTGVRFSPTASLRNGQRITIGARTHIGSGCAIWAGDASGRVEIGEDCLFGPDVFLTVANYRFAESAPIMRQSRDERDIIIGRDVWLGARVIVLAGVEIGAGTVVGAGSVVTRSLPPYSVAAGVPARVRGERLSVSGTAARP